MIAKFRKFRKSSPRRKIFFSVVWIVIGMAMISFLVVSNWRMMQRRAELHAQVRILEKKIQAIERKNKQLRAGILRASEKDYLDEVAREKFNLKLPGEKAVVIERDKQSPSKTEPENKKQGFFQTIWQKLKNLL